MESKIKKDLTIFIKIYHTFSMFFLFILFISALFNVQLIIIGLLFLINILAVYYKINKVGDIQSSMYINHIIRTIKRCFFIILIPSLSTLAYMYIKMLTDDSQVNYTEMGIIHLLIILPVFLSYFYFLTEMIRAAYRFHKNKDI